jgi:hypothetical protein
MQTANDNTDVSSSDGSATEIGNGPELQGICTSLATVVLQSSAGSHTGATHTYNGSNADFVTLAFGIFEEASAGPVTASLTEGVEFSDGAVAQTTELVSLDDGVNFSEDITTVTYESWGGDGLKFSEQLSGGLEASDSLTEGVKFSEQLESITLQKASLTEGINFEDDPNPVVTDVEALVEGMEFSDSTNVVVTDVETLVEGVVFSETLEIEGDIPASLDEGAVFSDEPVVGAFEFVSESINFSDEPSATTIYSEELSSGVTFSEILVGESNNAFSDSLTEGVEFSDTPTFVVTLVASLSELLVISEDISTVTYESWGGDGFALSDEAIGASNSASIDDGVIFSETLVGEGPNQVEVTEGIKFSDTPTGIYVEVTSLTEGLAFSEDFSLTIEEPFDDEGVVFSDEVQILTQLQLEEGFTLSDTPIIGGAAFLTEDVDFSDELTTFIEETLDEGMVFSDSPTGTSVGTVGAVASEGIVFSESLTEDAIYPTSANEGINFGDTLDLLEWVFLEDGIKISESLSTLRVAEVTLVEGMELSEAIAVQWDAHTFLTDGFKFSEDITLAINGKPVGIAFGITDITTINRPSIRR